MSLADLLAEITEREPWRDRAACRGQNMTGLFYPERGESTVAAKQVCEGCPVRAHCAASAFARHEKFGIWGGLSERQRRARRRDTREAA